MPIIVRKARCEDRRDAVTAEGKAVRSLFYLDEVWDEFFRDQTGELLVGEVDGHVVAVGKYTLLYDGSAWLETLRVDPEYQGQGIGKAFYTRFLERAAFQGVHTLGMYTGSSNVVSKGLAERFGFRLSAAYRGASWKTDLAGVQDTQSGGVRAASGPVLATDAAENSAGFLAMSPGAAVAQLLPLAESWDGHIIMNRTFYPANAATFAGMARDNKVYHRPCDGSICILGYRFLRERGLHLALAVGNIPAILDFAKNEVRRQELPQVTIMFPPRNQVFEKQLTDAGFVTENSDCIVMTRLS